MSDLQKRLEQFLIERNQPLDISPLTQDASTREYFRIKWNQQPAIACVYPFNELCFGQFEACLDVTNVFLSENLPVAEIYVSDAEKQIVIHEDFGDVILRDVLLKAGDVQRENILNEAIKLIARIQAATDTAFALNSVASRLKFDEEKLLWELNFFKEHYFTSFKKQPLSAEDDARLAAEFIQLARALETRAAVLCHRDFHAANLMIDRENHLRIIDHQDARIGSAAYDLVSLLLDRITVLPTSEWLAEKRAFFLSEREKLGLEMISEDKFAAEFNLQTIQRGLKAIGTFSFQSTFRGKTYFVPYIEPMLQIVCRSAANLDNFPFLQKIIQRQINE